MTQEFVTLPREVVERALAALDAEDPYRAAIALRAALEQPQGEQEPVAVVDFTTEGWRKIVDALRTLPDGAQLYTHPQPKREPLTHYEIHELFRRSWDYCQDGDEIKAFARAIEHAHNIK